MFNLRHIHDICVAYFHCLSLEVCNREFVLLSSGGRANYVPVLWWFIISMYTIFLEHCAEIRIVAQRKKNIICYAIRACTSY